MPPKKKKEPKNAYYFFMKDYKEKMRSKGVKFQGMNEVADAAGPKWREMSAAERAPYEEEARLAKQADKNDLSNKFTSQGVSYAQLKQEEEERREKESAMEREIEQTIQALDIPEGLKKQPFYVIHMNYLCRREKTYYPCEIAIARFNLEKGVLDSMHSMIELREVPAGFAYEARKISADTHEIPLPDLDNQTKDFTDDYMTLLIRIETFLKVDRPDNTLPPLYTMSGVIDPVISGLDYLRLLCNVKGEGFRVYPLAKMFLELRRACASHVEGVGIPVLAVAERELMKEIFNFAPGIGCTFHEPRERVYMCSRAIVHSWCFIIADHCCQDLAIELIPGQHIPKGSRVPALDRRNQFEDFTVRKPEQRKPFPRAVPRNSGDLLISAPLPELRVPNTMPIAVASMVKDDPHFSSEEFPPLGRGANCGVYGSLPLAVAQRGRGSRPGGIGRGRSLAATLGNMSLE